jgi:hypothetical protein
MRTFHVAMLAFFSAASCLPSLDSAPDSSIFSLFSFSQAAEVTPATPAITSITPAPGALLSSQTITIRFNRSMNQATCTFLGTVGAATAAWSSSSLTDDTVTLTGPWSAGTGRTLLVMNCETTDGTVITTASRLWDVFAPSTVRYVRAGASGLNDGLTAATPMPDLQNAIDQLDALPCATSCAVLVTNGTYSQAAAYRLRANVSLYGSYSTDFSTRNPANFGSVLTRSGCAAVNPATCSTVTADATITGTTRITGFDIVAGTGSDSSAAMQTLGCPVILANRLRGGSGDNDSQGLLIGGAPCMINIYANVIEGGSSPNSSVGLYLTADAAVNVENNVIVGGSNALATGTAVFLFGVTGSKFIANNIILGGAVNEAGGIQLAGTGSTTGIFHNTIVAGTAASSSSHGIIVTPTDTLVKIRSNHIEARGAASSCMTESGPVPTLQLDLIRNNFHGCSTLYFDSVVGAITDVPTLNTHDLVDPGGAFDGNVSLTPNFVNPAALNYRYGTSSPCGLTQGAALPPDTPVDITAAGRPGADAFASIGAFEYDGACAP